MYIFDDMLVITDMHRKTLGRIAECNGVQVSARDLQRRLREHPSGGNLLQCSDACQGLFFCQIQLDKINVVDKSLLDEIHLWWAAEYPSHAPCTTQITSSSTVLVSCPNTAMIRLFPLGVSIAVRAVAIVLIALAIHQLFYLPYEAWCLHQKDMLIATVN